MSDKTRTIFKKYSKSFFFAGIFLNDQTFKDSSVLYEFCRYVDDLADRKYKHKKIRVKKVMDNVIKGKGNLKIKKAPVGGAFYRVQKSKYIVTT